MPNYTQEICKILLLLNDACFPVAEYVTSEWSLSQPFFPIDEKYSVNIFIFSKKVHGHHRIGRKVNFVYMTTVNS